MRDLMRSILPIIIIISIFSTSLIIPADCLARYEIRKEETFGDPGDDPTISIDPLSSSEEETALTASSFESSNIEESLLKMNLKMLLNQLANILF
ncbi:MAG: hypothetical protein GF417_11930 [Candidatus Latescibacteria bacterium]|nr:hypothetical protein [Candidatus Latescibacterota bacterium]